MQDIQLGDVVQMKKGHPCGGNEWLVIRTGADIKIRCRKCERVVMMDRVVFLKRVKKTVGHVDDVHGTNEEM